MKIRFIKAANGDAILISTDDYFGLKRNILIDGGSHKTYYDNALNKYGELYYALNEIRDNHEKIDILIITHIDDDHINGLLKWFELDNNAHSLVSEVWFNSGQKIANYFKGSENRHLHYTIRQNNNSFTSISKAISLEEYLEKNHVKFYPIVRKGDIINRFGIEFKIISPTDEDLKKLIEEYVKATVSPLTSSGTSDWKIDIEQLIENEKVLGRHLSFETSLTNKSSIAFIMTFNKKSYLFLGDSHVATIVQSLKELKYIHTNQLEVELIKLSHHGSKKNTNDELLKIVKTNQYVISTDSTLHSHPDKMTIARIINNNPKANIYFNYEHVKNGIFTEKDRANPRLKDVILRDTSEL